MLDYLRIILGPRVAKMDERGDSAVEYGLLVASLGALMVVVVLAFGAQLSTVFSSTCESLAGSSTC